MGFPTELAEVARLACGGSGLPRGDASCTERHHLLQVRIAEAEKDVPLYAVIRKWIQNDPDSEMMPLPAHGDDLAEAKRSMAPKLPPVPKLPEEEPKPETALKEAPVSSQAEEPASVEVRLFQMTQLHLHDYVCTVQHPMTKMDNRNHLQQPYWRLVCMHSSG